MSTANIHEFLKRGIPNNNEWRAAMVFIKWLFVRNTALGYGISNQINVIVFLVTYDIKHGKLEQRQLNLRAINAFITTKAHLSFKLVCVGAIMYMHVYNIHLYVFMCVCGSVAACKGDSLTSKCSSLTPRLMFLRWGLLLNLELKNLPRLDNFPISIRDPPICALLLLEL